MQFKIKFARGEIESLRRQMIERLEELRPIVAKRVAEAIEKELTKATGGQIELVVKVDGGNVHVAAYGKEAGEHEKRFKSFQNVYGMLPNIINSIKW